MITEAHAWWATPETGWVREYMQHAVKQTTAPVGYHLANALTLLAATTPENYGHRFAGNLYANLYVLLVGRSGDEQKSTTLKIAREILYAADLPLAGEEPGSVQGLMDSLADQPKQIIYYSEFGEFLAQAQRKGGHFEPLKAALTNAWDCTPLSRRKADTKAKDGSKVVTKITVPNPRLSIGAACSLTFLEQHTNAEDWSGGFMGRWAVIHARRERTDPDPVGDPTQVPILAHGLKLRAAVPEVGVCLGLSNAAKERWNEWYYGLEARPIPDIIAGVRTRAATIARKAAMIYAWDFGEPFQMQPWYLEPHHLEYGIRFAELHIYSVLSLSQRIAQSGDARLRNKVLELIPVGGSMPLSELLRQSGILKRKLAEVLEGLVLERAIAPAASVGAAGDILYYRAG